jgi:hypothetical protein
MSQEFPPGEPTKSPKGSVVPMFDDGQDDDNDHVDRATRPKAREANTAQTSNDSGQSLEPISSPSLSVEHSGEQPGVGKKVALSVGLWWEAISLAPLVAVLYPLAMFLVPIWAEKEIRVAILCAGCSLCALVAMGKRRGSITTVRIGFAVGMLCCAVFTALASWLSQSLLWPLLSISFSLTAWGSLRVRGERISRFIVVSLSLLLPAFFELGLFTNLRLFFGRIVAWTASGLLDLWTIPHLRRLSIIELGGADIDFDALTPEFNSLIASIGVAILLAILFRRSMLVGICVVFASMFCWVVVESLEWFLVISQFTGGTPEELSLLVQSCLFGILVLGVFCFDQFIAIVLAPISMNKFDSELPVITQLWNIIVAFPAPARKLDRVGDDYINFDSDDEMEIASADLQRIGR